MKLKVGTFNILNVCLNYPARKKYISKTIQEMDCDILGLQEINIKGNVEVQRFEKYNFQFVELPEPMIVPIPDF